MTAIHNFGIKVKEVWKPIPGWEGYYQASSFGRIRSIDRVVWSKAKYLVNYKGRILSPKISSDGYAQVLLSRDCKCSTHSVHRLVAMTFLPNPDGKETVNHIDGHKLNNNFGNLEWATRLEQVTHAYQMGMYKVSLNAEQINALKARYSEVKNYAVCAREFKISWHMAKYFVNKKNAIGVRD